VESRKAAYLGSSKNDRSGKKRTTRENYSKHSIGDRGLHMGRLTTKKKKKKKSIGGNKRRGGLKEDLGIDSRTNYLGQNFNNNVSTSAGGGGGTASKKTPKRGKSLSPVTALLRGY